MATRRGLGTQVSHRRRPNGTGRARNVMRNVAESAIERDFDVRRARVTVLPPLTESTITVMRKFQGQFILSSTASGERPVRIFGIADMAGLAPGGTTFWNRVRVERVSVYLKPDQGTQALSQYHLPQLQVQIPGDDTIGSPPTTFRAQGVEGNSLAMIGWRFGMAQRMRWWNPSATQSLFTVSVDDTDGGQWPMFVEVTLELVSPQLTY